MAGRTNQLAGDHGRDGAMPRWAVGIAVVLAVLWATYLLLSGAERARKAADQAVDRATQVGDAASKPMVSDVDADQQITDKPEGATTALSFTTGGSPRRARH